MMCRPVRFSLFTWLDLSFLLIILRWLSPDNMKYQFVIALKNNADQNTASSKAVNDCTAILEQQGYKNFNIYFVKDKKLALFNLLKLTFHLFKMTVSIKSRSVIVIQYPLLGINQQINILIKLLRNLKKCRFVCITHDVESLRTNSPDLFASDIHNLSQYDVVITHNNIMANWLKHQGLKTKLISLEIFDYLSSGRNAAIGKRIDQSSTSVAFAGNLSKSGFIYQLSTISVIKFNLYGPHVDLNRINTSNTKWQGSFNSDDILNELTGQYGLIWDGDTIDKCSGEMGQYLQFNNPHKLSLYLAAGLPVIVPENSAVAFFVSENKLGVTVANLNDLSDKLKSVTAGEYDSFKANAARLGTKLLSGHYFSAALDKAEAILQ